MMGLATAAVTCIVAVPVANAAGPPPGRAYELISPGSGVIAGVSTDAFPLPGLSSADGDRLSYGASSVIGASENGPTNPQIFGVRTATGWVSRSAIRSVDPNTALEVGKHEPLAGWMNAAGDEMTFGLTHNLGGIPGVSSSDPAFGSLYSSTDSDAAPNWLSQPAPGVALADGVSSMPTVADDNRVVAVNSTAPLTTDGLAGTWGVYVRRNGAWQLASRLPGGTVPVQGALMPNTAGVFAPHQAANAPSVATRNQLADNGRFLLFMTGVNVGDAPLYVRDLENDVTHQLAGGAPGIAGNAGQLATKWGAAGTSLEAPTETIVDGIVTAAENGPYAYFKEVRPGSNVTDAYLSQANLETGVVTARPELNGPPLSVSPDGRRVLFLRPPANGQAIGNWTLRYWDMANPGTSVALGAVPASAYDPYGTIRVYRSQQDGQSWIFTSKGDLDPSRPSQAPNDTQQLYRWQVGDTHPKCLTCEPVDGVARLSGVSLTVQESLSSELFLAPTTPIDVSANKEKRRLAQPGHSISDDGRWLLFDSPDQLVSEDTNGVRDVYLWDRDAPSGQQLQLVTSGIGSSPSYALDLDPSGKTAFFTTRDGLVPADKNGSYDVYAARIGGGFPDDDTSCVGEECRPPVLIPPTKDPILSNLITPPSSGPQQAVQQGTPKLRVRALRTTSKWLTVRVDTPKAGRIAVSGSRVKSTKRTAKRAATYTLKVPLNATAQRLVARGRTVKVSLRVQFTPTGAKKASRVSTSVSIKKGR